MQRKSRRSVLKGGAAIAGAYTLGFPSIARSQTDKIKIGHLTPLTGLPGRARRLRPARPQDGRGGDQQGRRRHGTPARHHLGRLGQPGHRRHQGPAHARAGRRHGPDGRDQLGLGGHHHAGGGAQQAPLHAGRRALGRTARQELQPLLLPRRHPQHGDGQRGGQGAAARQHGQRQEVHDADGRLRVRSRPAARGQDVLCGQ